jgi:4-deoxy-L-threo-5-hexosulose-uronate ketol-isomerase
MNMEVRYAADPVRFPRMTTEEIRDNFLIQSLFKVGEIEMVYSDTDRAIIGSALPFDSPIILSATDELRAAYFNERRELGVLNVGGKGTVEVNGKNYKMKELDCLYIGKGNEKIAFTSDKADNPAAFYLLSYPAHTEYPTKLSRKEDAEPQHLGSDENSNKRTIYKHIHSNGIKSCQLVMGVTIMAAGNVWNTMPPHTHERRMEVYFYFGMEESERVFHLCGKPIETRHIVVSNRQAVISPSWSIHSGVGTSAYSFCWGMGGENQSFDDMDHLDIGDLK